MTIGSLALKLRPLRVGFLVNPTDKSSVSKAIHLNSLLWGGMFNPLIPCFKKLPTNWQEYKSKHTTAANVISGYIEGFDPDYLVNITDIDKSSINFVKERIVTYEDVISDFSDDMTPSLGAGIFEVISQFKHDELRFVRRSPLRLIRPKLSNHHNLFLASIFGSLGDFDSAFYDDYLMGIEAESAPINVKNYPKYISAKYLFPRRIGAFYVEQRVSGPVLFYLDASKILDVIDYWNMRAAGWQVYPVAKQSEYEPELLEFCKATILEAYKPLRFNKQIFHRATIIKSRNTTEKEVNDFYTSLNITLPEPNDGGVISFQRWYPRLWDDWARQNTDEEVTPAYSSEKEIELQKGQTELRFKTPNPEFELFGFSSEHPRFAVEIDSRVYGSKELLAEVIPLGGEQVSRAVGKYYLREWRISRAGPVYLADYPNWTIDYEIPLAEPIMIAWFKERGWKIDISSSGKVAKQMIRHLGGSWGIAQLKQEKLIKLLQELSNNGFINENRFRGRISEITNADDRLITTDEYIKRLLESEIFQLGVETKCPVCTQKSWYSLKEIDSNIRCSSCLSEYKIQTLNLSDKKWAYKSFGTFGLPKQAYGAFGVLLTLNLLVNNRQRSTVLLSFTAQKNHKFIEADLCLIIEKEFRGNAKQEVLFCECKTYNKFEKKDVERMYALSEEFPGAVLVFSTFRTELTTAEKKMLRPLVNKGRKYWKSEETYNPVLIITGNEIFSDRGIPECWKGKDGKAGEIAENRFHPHSISDIADLTQQIYLDMKPYHQWREEQWKKRQKVN